MIPKARHLLPFVYLTLFMLAACEPLAPRSEILGATPDTTLATPGTRPSYGDPELISAHRQQVVTLIPTRTPTLVPLPKPTSAPPSLGCDETDGQIVYGSFYSAITEDEVNYRVYLPPCFFVSTQRYPYVILLHGTGYDDAMWDDLGVQDVMDNSLAKDALPPMVLFMPDGGALSEMNDQRAGESYADLLVDEFIPTIEAEYCLWGSREGRAIGGISRGGFWAFSTALQHLELFSTLGGHSPYFAEDNALPDSNPLDLARVANFAKNPIRIYMDNGADDVVGHNTMLMSGILRTRGISHEYTVSMVGGHDTDYWSAHLASYLAFYGEEWPHKVGELPSCFEPSP